MDGHYITIILIGFIGITYFLLFGFFQFFSITIIHLVD